MKTSFICCGDSEIINNNNQLCCSHRCTSTFFALTGEIFTDAIGQSIRMSVLSKIIDKTSARYGIKQEHMTRGVLGVATTLYLLKIGYPHIVASVKRRNNRKVIDETSSNKKSDCNENDEEDDAEESKSDNSDKLSLSTVKGIKTPSFFSTDDNCPDLVNIGLDKNFLLQLVKLLRIMVPGWRTREAGLLTCATVTLLARTFLSVYVATLEGQIVKRIVLKDVGGFTYMLARWFAIALPATFVNSAIRYLEGHLALSFRYYTSISILHKYKLHPNKSVELEMWIDARSKTPFKFILFLEIDRNRKK